MKQERVESLKRLHQTLEDHDWTYQYAEGQAWYDGNREEKVIQSMKTISDTHLKLVMDYTAWWWDKKSFEKPDINDYIGDDHE